MLHTRHHEEPNELRAALLAHFRADAVKVANGIERRDGRAGPGMKTAHFAAARREFAQVRIGGVHQGAELLDDARRIAIEIELLQFPIGILLHHGAHIAPAELGLRTLSWGALTDHAHTPA